MNMRKAMMPVPYIIALIIGVIVVSVLAYWFISSSGKGSCVGKEAECRARVLEWCVTQTDIASGKAQNVCSGCPDFSRENWDKFCCGIIPDWKSSTGKSCDEITKP